ncbi:hypothetical protein E4T96_14325 [Shigella flexneri]|nr:MULTISPECIES: hypothetical protein [Enterobacteriaceae]AQW73427.1 hypothetical protein B2H83_11800 [Escherichia coli M8]EFB1459253.1 hypothetical protein [Escherichia coli]EFC1584018.1 hypothetical protein [Escherichia coli]EFE9638196.1 hypothetical protein [Escherichia coli]EFM6399290.1 hypothetical protein [Escherichia coli]
MQRNYLKLVLFYILFVFASHGYASEWYEGGTLHKANALEWQKASYKNKLATSADFIAVLYNQGRLTPELSTQVKNMDDLKLLAEELTKQLDMAFEPFADKKKNRKVYQNQSVSNTAVSLMLMMGWIKS